MPDVNEWHEIENERDDARRQLTAATEESKRLRGALETIAAYETDWRSGPAQNVANLQRIAEEVLTAPTPNVPAPTGMEPPCGTCGGDGITSSCPDCIRYGESSAPQAPATGLPPFEKAWARYEAKGYQYGEDALTNVEFGYEIAAEELAALAAHPSSGGVK